MSRGGTISLGNHCVPAAEIHGGRRVSIRVEAAPLMLVDPDAIAFCRSFARWLR